MERRYRELPHTADIALEVWGGTLEELFAHAAEGLFDLAAATEPNAPVANHRQVELTAPDAEVLLVDWLNELLLLHEQHGEVYVTFDLSLRDGTALSARIGATQAFRPKIGIKAATFHDLAIRQEAQGYRAVVVFDV